MKYRVALTMASRNVKTGPIPVSTTESASCAEDCPFREGPCYARTGPLKLFWDKIDAGKVGMPWDDFLRAISKLPKGTLWRHNQAGDLPGDGILLDLKDLGDLVKANRGKQGFTYTHYDPRNKWNASLIESANHYGFTINLSANSLEEADELYGLGVGPVVCVVPEDWEKEIGLTPGGKPYFICPAQLDRRTCQTCTACARQRRTIVAFRAHGSRAKAASKIARGEHNEKTNND